MHPSLLLFDADMITYDTGSTPISIIIYCYYYIIRVYTYAYVRNQDDLPVTLACVYKDDWSFHASCFYIDLAPPPPPQPS